MAIARNRDVFGKVAAHQRDCQRCGQRFTTKKIHPYCSRCFRDVRRERLAAYLDREAKRMAEKQARCASVED